MRKKYIFGKKLYISILTTIVVLLTTVATTFAWVGVFANSTFDAFNIGVKVSNLEEFGIEISLTGEPKSFSDSLDPTQLKKQILLNWGFDESQLDSEYKINSLFSSVEMEQCTTLPNIVENEITSLGLFKDMYGIETTHYFKFDIYVSATKFYDKEDSSTFNLDVYLNEDLMEGNAKKRDLFKPFQYPSTFVNPYETMIANNLMELPYGIIPLKGNDRLTSATIDSSYATRVAFEKYKVVDEYNTSAYTSTDKPISTVIYQKGYEYPVYDTVNDLYDFGGILPDEINMSTAYFNSSESRYLSDNFKTISIPDEMYAARGVESNTKDLIINSSTNHLIDSSNPNEQISVNQMMKITCYFWFEGWDADCFKAIAGSPVSLKIEFSSKNE